MVSSARNIHYFHLSKQKSAEMIRIPAYNDEIYPTNPITQSLYACATKNLYAILNFV